MIAVKDKLISEDLLEKHFVCNLQACKGACCWEGEVGAPLRNEELKILDRIWKKLSAYISKSSYQKIERDGPYVYDKNYGYVTNLMPDGACVFMTRDKEGIAQCGIELAYKDGIQRFPKPISCHLYPIRIIENPNQGFTALNYDRWNICNPACKKGKELGIPVFQFVKDALIRRFGKRFYNELERIYKQWKENKTLK